jgi:hypothetical protein
MSVFNLGAIEVFAAIGLIAPRLGGHAMHSDLTKVSLLIALTAAAIYHVAALVAFSY